MIVRILGVILLIAIALPVEAQNQYRYGFKGGISNSEIRSDDFVAGTRWGINVGLFATTPLRGNLELLGELAYHQKGRSEEGEVRDRQNAILGSDGNYRYDYASLLLAPHYQADLGSGRTQLFAYLGPRLDAFIGQRLTYSNTEGDRVAFEDSDDSGTKGLILGASAGVGIDVSRAFVIPLLVELRYNTDVTPAYNFEVGDRDFTSRHRTFDFRLGLSF